MEGNSKNERAKPGNEEVNLLNGGKLQNQVSKPGNEEVNL